MVPKGHRGICCPGGTAELMPHLSVGGRGKGQERARSPVPHFSLPSDGQKSQV